MATIVIDCGISNIKSVKNTFHHLGLPIQIAAHPMPLAANDLLVLPGVGAFESGMAQLSASGWIPEIKAHILAERPFLGICLGFQLLFDSSDENGRHQGMGIFPGHIKKFNPLHKKVPHMGWNSLDIRRDPNAVSDGLEKAPYVYYVHSYFLPDQPENELISATTTYEDETFVGVIQQPRLMGTQFHPEKSGTVGIQMLTNFIHSLS
jgi:glutamine amidotransferase